MCYFRWSCYKRNEEQTDFAELVTRYYEIRFMNVAKKIKIANIFLHFKKVSNECKFIESQIKPQFYIFYSDLDSN